MTLALIPFSFIAKMNPFKIRKKVMQVGAMTQAPSPILSLIEQIILFFRLVALKCTTHSSVLFFAVDRTNTFGICSDHDSWAYDSLLRLLNCLLIERFLLGFVRSMTFRRIIHDLYLCQWVNNAFSTYSVIVSWKHSTCLFSIQRWMQMVILKM